ncbi:hypothetical protein [Roseivivax sp. CAU 1761]
MAILYLLAALAGGLIGALTIFILGMPLWMMFLAYIGAGSLALLLAVLALLILDARKGWSGGAALPEDLTSIEQI